MGGDVGQGRVGPKILSPKIFSPKIFSPKIFTAKKIKSIFTFTKNIFAKIISNSTSKSLSVD